ADPLPYSAALSFAGLQLRTIERKRPALGFTAERDATGALIVSEVDGESPAAEAGLLAGDIIVGWNGAKPPHNLGGWLYAERKGGELRLNVRGEEKNISAEYRLGEITETLYRVTEDPHASDKARRIRDGLLRGVTQPVTASVQ